MDMKEYVPEIDEYWYKLNESSAKLILSQAESTNSELIKAADELTKRSVTIMQFVTPLIIVLFAYISSKYQDPNLLFQLAVIGIIGATITLIYSFKTYNLYEIKPSGNLPKNVLKKEYVEYEKQYSWYLYNSIILIQRYCDFNSRENSKRVSCLKKVFRTIKYSFIALFAYLVVGVVIHLLQ